MLCREIIQVIEATYPRGAALDFDNVGLLAGRAEKKVNRIYLALDATDHVIECAEILKRHGCMQAMNLDGGTSAMMYFDGEYITKCSNQSLPYGRPLPPAFVYKRAE